VLNGDRNVVFLRQYFPNMLKGEGDSDGDSPGHVVGGGDGVGDRGRT
jgi:hypothetical protein